MLCHIVGGAHAGHPGVVCDLISVWRCKGKVAEKSRRTGYAAQVPA